MAVARSFRALELYDVLTNLVPGAVVLLIPSIIFPVENFISSSTGTLGAGAFLVSALVFGHIVQVIASWLDGTPKLFGKVIRATRGEDVGDLPIDITYVEESVWPLMERQFALPENFDDYGEMFRLLLSYIETTPATRALRFQALHSFHRSMWAVGHIAVLITTIGILLKRTGLVTVRSWPVLSLALIGSLIGIWVFGQRKEKMNKRFIQYAIADFYIHQTEKRDNSHWRSGS
ncbi:hypothetical protein SAMN05444422_10614 [Halobiforma haloterrestris]|uniref:Uncharacterized protein n=1 Tax=Natronobacterium haloterrestre TaxID=148448 RepID=A0A1I1HSN5_NATHA|nr:hypothetical protein SAMN05444422_10614 [Halobiforma haloterrestris]